MTDPTPREQAWMAAALVCREVAELPDRTSPNDNADFMLVTGDELQPMVAAAIEAVVADERAKERARLKECVDLRLNNYLVEMKPDYDDSITGFNEAWEVVRAIFAEAIERGEDG